MAAGPLAVADDRRRPARTPCRTNHAIFVREGAERVYNEVDTIPETLSLRPISLRAFNAAFHAALKAANQHIPQLLPVLEQNLSSTKSEALQSYSLQRRYTFLKPVPMSDIRDVLHNIATTVPQAANTNPKSVVDNKALFG